MLYISTLPFIDALPSMVSTNLNAFVTCLKSWGAPIGSRLQSLLPYRVQWVKFLMKVCTIQKWSIIIIIIRYPWTDFDTCGFKLWFHFSRFCAETLSRRRWVRWRLFTPQRTLSVRRREYQASPTRSMATSWPWNQTWRGWGKKVSWLSVERIHGSGCWGRRTCCKIVHK